jgi:hypothetical protein
MCFPSGGGSAPPPPPDPRIEEEAKSKRARERRVALAEKSQLKDESYERAIQEAYGLRSRRSLLAGTGRKGGAGFEIASGLLSKDTLGA